MDKSFMSWFLSHGVHSFSRQKVLTNRCFQTGNFFLSFVALSNDNKFDRRFSSCSWKNTNTKYSNESWLLVVKQ